MKEETLLTERERKFCLNYLRTANGAESARAAGYSEKSARQTATNLLTKPYIREFLEERRAEEDEELIASSREILRKLTAIMRNDYALNKDRIRAAELLAKFRGFVTDKIEVTQKEQKSNVVIYLPAIEEDPEDEE